MKNEIASADVLIVDLDDTLFIQSFWTRLFFRISKFWHKMALKCETLNRSLAEDIRNRKVVILSGRNLEGDKQLLEAKLKKYKIKYDEIILCPRTKILMDWKRKQLAKISKKHGSYYWIDDMA